MQAHTTTDLLWLLFCAILIFCMQAGFCCLESGLVRAKNSINVAIKNMANFCIAGILFWSIGFGLMFGSSHMGLLGTSNFFLGIIYGSAQITLGRRRHIPFNGA